MKQQYHLAEFTDIRKAETWLNDEFQNGYRLHVGPMQGAGQFFFFVTERIPEDTSKRRQVRESATKENRAKTPPSKPKQKKSSDREDKTQDDKEVSE